METINTQENINLNNCIDGNPEIVNSTMEQKQRINYSQSVFIGGHVWIGHLAYISKGVKTESGAIVDNYSFVPHNSILPCNSLVVSNPIKIEKRNVFYIKEFLGFHRAEDSLNTQQYKSDVFYMRGLIKKH